MANTSFCPSDLRISRLVSDTCIEVELPDVLRETLSISGYPEKMGVRSPMRASIFSVVVPTGPEIVKVVILLSSSGNR